MISNHHQTSTSAVGELIVQEIHTKAAKHLHQQSSSSSNDINPTFQSILAGLAVFPKDIQSCVAYHHFKKYNNPNYGIRNINSSTPSSTSRPAKLNLLVVCGGQTTTNGSTTNPDSMHDLDPIQYEAEVFNIHNQHQILHDLLSSSSSSLRAHDDKNNSNSNNQRKLLTPSEIDDYYNYYYIKQNNNNNNNSSHHHSVELERVAFSINGTPDQRIDAYTKLLKRIVNHTANTNNHNNNNNPRQVEYVGVISSKFLVADILHKRISLCLLGGVVFINAHRATSVEKFVLSLLQPQDAFEESALIMSMNAGSGAATTTSSSSSSSSSLRRTSRWGLFLTNHIPSISRQLLSTLNVLQVQLYPRCRVCIDDWMTQKTKHAPSILEDFIAPPSATTTTATTTTTTLLSQQDTETPFSNDASALELINVIKTVFDELVYELNKVIIFSSEKYDAVRSMMELIGNGNAINNQQQHKQQQQQRQNSSSAISYITAEALISPLAFHLLKKVVRNLPSTSRCRDICESLLHVRRMLRLAPRLDSGTFLAVLECIAAEALITRAHYNGNSHHHHHFATAFNPASFTSLYDTLLWLASPSSTQLLTVARRRAYEFGDDGKLRMNIEVPRVYLRVRQLLARIISRNPPTIPVAAAKDHGNYNINNNNGGSKDKATVERKKSVVLIIVPNRHDCGSTVLDDVRMSVSLNTIEDVKRAMTQRFIRRFTNNNNSNNKEKNQNNRNDTEQQQQQEQALLSEDAAAVTTFSTHQHDQNVDSQQQQQKQQENNQRLFVNDGDDMMMFMSSNQNLNNASSTNSFKTSNHVDNNALKTVKTEQNIKRIINNDLFDDDDDDDQDEDEDNDDGDQDNNNDGDESSSSGTDDNKNSSNNNKTQSSNSSKNNTSAAAVLLTQQNPLGMLSCDLKESLSQQKHQNDEQQQQQPTAEIYDEENLNSRTQHERTLLLKQETEAEKSQLFLKNNNKNVILDDDDDDDDDDDEVVEEIPTNNKNKNVPRPPPPAPRHSIVDVDALSSDDDDDDDDVMIVGVSHQQQQKQLPQQKEKNNDESDENEGGEREQQQNVSEDVPPHQQHVAQTAVVVNKSLINAELPANELQLYSDARIESLPSFIQRRREILSASRQQQQQQNPDSNLAAASSSSSSYRRPLHQFVLPAPQNLPREECWRYSMHDEGVDVVCATLNAVSLNLLREVLDPGEYKKSRQVFCLDVNLNFLRTLELFQAEEGIALEKNNNGNAVVKPAKIHVRIIAEQGSSCHEDVLHEIDEERNAVKRVSFYSKTHTPRLIYRSLQPASTLTMMTTTTNKRNNNNNDDDDDDDDDANGTSMASLMMMNTIQNLSGGNNSTARQHQHQHLQQHQIPPTVLVDDRELRAELPLHLHEAGLRIIPLTLVRGDYIIARDIAVERKAVADLCQSLRSGRLNNQLSSIQAFFRYGMILIELSNGHGAPPASTTEFSGQQPGMKETLAKLVLNTNRSEIQIQGQQPQAQQQYPKQICILWSTGPAHSAKIIVKLKNTFAVTSNNNNNNNTNNQNEPDASDPSLVSDSLSTATASSTTSAGKITKLQQTFCESAGEVFHRLPGCAFVNVNRMIRQQQSFIDEKEEQNNKTKMRKTSSTTVHLNDDDDDHDADEDDAVDGCAGGGGGKQMSQMVNNLASLVHVSRNQKKLEQMFVAGSLKHPSASASATAAALELMNFLHTPLVPPIVL